MVYVVLCLIVFGCQYQCNWLPGKTRLRYDLLCVEWDVKPYTLTHSLSVCLFLCMSVCVTASALQYMRTKSVSHMDLKPQNILLSATSSPVLKIAGLYHHHHHHHHHDLMSALSSELSRWDAMFVHSAWWLYSADELLDTQCRYTQCRYTQCRYTQCRYTQCRYTLCRYTQCRYTLCRYTQCGYTQCGQLLT